MRMWAYSACSIRVRMVLSCCFNRRYFPCIWERIMKHDVHEPFRAIHGCIRRERNLETGHDAIPRSFTGWVYAGMVCIQMPYVWLFPWFRLRIGFPPPQTIGMDASQEKEGLGNRMTGRKPHGWRHGFGLDCTHCQHDGRWSGCVRRDGSVASMMLTVGMRCSWWWTLAGC